MTLVFWLLGPLLGLASAFLSIFLADLDFSDLKSYVGILSSLYFFAVSVSAVACAEAFELAFTLEPRFKNDRIGVVIGIGFTLNIIFFMILVSMYSKSISRFTQGHSPLGYFDIALPIFLIVIALGIGILFKIALERSRT